MADVPGKSPKNNIFDINSELVHSMMVDQNYLMVAAYVDENLRMKIVNGEYVDFARLLPHDRVTVEEDHRMELVNCGGQACYMPVADREIQNNSISSFNKWEQAFRVFTDIYSRQYPNQSAELIQYNHVIHTAALTYRWDNVYKYDKQFRIHMARHPHHSWGIICNRLGPLRSRINMVILHIKMVKVKIVIQRRTSAIDSTRDVAHMETSVNLNTGVVCVTSMAMVLITVGS